MGEIKQVNIKSKTYCFYDGMVNIKDFDPNLLKIDKKSFKNIGVYYIGYIKRKDSVNALYLLIHRIEGFIKEKEGNKYLSIASTDSNSEVSKKYKEIWNRIKDCIGKKNGSKSGEYGQDYMKITFISDDDLHLNKQLKFLRITIIVRTVFEEDGKYYPQIFLDECLYKV